MILTGIVNDPIWLMVIFFIVIGGLIVAGRAKGALVLVHLLL